MQRKVALTGQARDDLDAIWNYTAEQYGADATDEYVRSFNEIFAHLGEFSHIGAPVKGLRPASRSIRHRHYRLYYRMIDDAVEVLTIVHGARDVSQLLG